MSAEFKKSLIIFVIGSVVVTLVLCLLPIRVFDGEAIWISAGNEIVLSQQISLSYFFDIGIDKEYFAMVEGFRLTGKGWMLAFIFIIGIPALISYRFYLKGSQKSND